MKKSIIILFIIFLTSNINAQSFSELISTTGSNKKVEWVTSSYGNGYGAKIYNMDEGSGKTSLRFGVRSSAYSNWSDVFFIESSDLPSNGFIGVGGPPSHLFTLYNRHLAWDASSGSVDLFFKTSGVGNKISAVKETYNTAGLAFYTHYGWVNPEERLRISAIGNVGIGTSSPVYKLDVNGTIRAKEIKVNLNAPAADYVFHNEYDLKSLEEVESFINENKHLPNMIKGETLEKNGLDLSKFQMKLLEKIEELTLYTIQQNQQIKKLQKENEQLKSINDRVEQLEELLKSL